MADPMIRASGALPVSVVNGICLVDGIAPTSTPEPTATATVWETPAPTATTIETAAPTPEPESMHEETSAPESPPPSEQPAGNPESAHDSTPAEYASGFGVITACAGILIVSFVLKRRRY